MAPEECFKRSSGLIFAPSTDGGIARVAMTDSFKLMKVAVQNTGQSQRAAANLVGDAA